MPITMCCLLVALLLVGNMGMVGALATSMLGVEPGREDSYSGSSFKCLDGTGEVLPAAAINDESCDCADGSDEPGTGACAGQDKTLFFCANKGSMPRRLYASRVGDGVCDCCDGSDEASLTSRRKHTPKCEDVCAIEGARKNAERMEKVEMLKRALKRKEEIHQEGLSAQAKFQQDVESLTKDLAPLEAALEAATKAADVEREAKKKADEEEAARKKAEEAAASPTSSDEDAAKEKAEEDGAKVEPAEEGQASTQEEEKPQVSEYSKWMDGAESTMTKGDDTKDDSKEEKQVSEYAKWMEGAGEDEDEAAGSDETATADAEAPAADAPAADNAEAEPQQKTAVDLETEAKSAVTDHKDKIQDLQDQIDTLTTDKLGYASLNGKTLSKRVSEFEYSIEFFAKASQDSVSLGTWAKWTGPRSAVFEHGTMCWGGPERKLNVNFVCGETEQIIDCFEPSRCVYEATVEHPGACEQAELDALAQGLQVVGPKDEL